MPDCRKAVESYPQFTAVPEVKGSKLRRAFQHPRGIHSFSIAYEVERKDVTTLPTPILRYVRHSKGIGNQFLKAALWDFLQVV